jgi:hypothetical protein
MHPPFRVWQKEGGADMKKLMVTAIVLGLVAGGCVTDPEVTDEDHIYNLIASSGTVSMGPLDGRGETGGKDVGLPEAWWRELTGEGMLTVFLENDPATGICTVTVSRNLDAIFNIDVIHDGNIEPGTKTIADFRYRRVVVQNTGETGPHGGWELVALTPATYGLRDEASQEVFISSMRLYRDDELIWECNDPDRFYLVDGEIPYISEGDFLRFEAEAVHLNPQYQPEFFVFVHGPCPTWPRHLMYDNGLYGDLVADDGVFTYEWYAEDTQYNDMWGIAADVIDAETMNDSEEEDYDSGAWGMPLHRG